uniref:BHLH domain-containing protein n=1 Tax=Malurus cyaneus samueli TaxID=2593467 RepID=A0A8C5U5C7_9PASS
QMGPVFPGSCRPAGAGGGWGGSTSPDGHRGIVPHPRWPAEQGRQRARGGGGAGVPRQSASEREKLRMRRLAQALLRLRHYLPPALAPAGQSLTKIETLRLATRYIAHLSAQLGLGRGTAAPRHCPLCPRGLGCCQDAEPRDASLPGAAGWGSPPVAGTPPELHGAPGMGTGAWGSPLCSPAAGTPPEMFGCPEMGLGTWGPAPYMPVTGILPELQRIPSLDKGPSCWPGECRCLLAPLSIEPLQHRCLVLLHPVDVGTGPLQCLLQRPRPRPKADVLVVLLELLQLPGRDAGRGWPHCLWQIPALLDTTQEHPNSP